MLTCPMNPSASSRTRTWENIALFSSSDLRRSLASCTRSSRSTIGKSATISAPATVGSVGKRLQLPESLLYLLRGDFSCPCLAESGCGDSPDCFQYQLRTYREEGQPSECRECDLWSDLPEYNR